MAEEQKEIKPGIYRHYKGLEYQVYFCAKHSETEEDVVVYQKIEDKSFWVRPKEMFLEEVEIDGQKKPRFEFVRAIDEEKEMEKKYLRALADYDNLKKETARERAEMGKFASAVAAYQFVAIYENFKKAAKHMPEANENLEEYKKLVEQWTAGIEHIKKQFGETLKQLGLEEIKTAGEKFNPILHEAAGEEAVENVTPGQVLKEVEGGYKIGDKVVKAVKVIVSK